MDFLRKSRHLKQGGIFKLDPRISISQISLFEILEKQPFACIITDHPGYIVYANMLALNMSGYTKLAGKKMNDILIIKENDQKSQTVKSGFVITTLIHKAGRQIPILIKTSEITLQAKKYTCNYFCPKDFLDSETKEQMRYGEKCNQLSFELKSAKKDLDEAYNHLSISKTDKKKYQEAHKKESQKFKALFNDLQDIVLILDHAGDIHSMNENAREKLLISTKKEATHNIFEFIIPEDQTRLKNLMKTLTKEHQGFRNESNLIVNGGRETPVEISCSLLQTDETHQILCYIRDISLRKSFEKGFKKLKNEARKKDYNLQSVFDTAASTMFILNNQLIVTNVNITGLEEFGIDRTIQEMPRIGELIHCLNTEHDSRSCGMGKSCASCELYRNLKTFQKDRKNIRKKELSIFTLSKKQVVKRYVLLSVTNLQAENSILVTLDDISKSKNIENELLLAKEKAEESDRLKTSFLNNLSHELRTPLNGIMGFSELLMNTSSPSEMRNFSSIINKSGKRLLGVIEDLFIVSSLISGTIRIDKRDYKLSRVIDNIKLLLYEEHLATEHRQFLELKYNLPEILNGEMISVDISMLMIVMKNLCRNALKFTPKGQIEFGFQNSKTDDYIFYVKDTGIGIPEEKQDYIFQYFRQGDEQSNREFGGIGTGLSIAKSLVDKMNGKIWVESQHQKGSVFFFSIPKSETINNKTEPDPDLIQKCLLNKKILVVEDMLENYLLLEVILSEYNTNTVQAISGEEAMEIIRKENDFDLVLMDLRLPGIDGFDTTRAIKQINPDIKVIAQSAMASTEDIEKAFAHGCDEFISKPIMREILLEKVVAILCKEEG